MGVWGPKLYQNDLANDIKNEYQKLLQTEKKNQDIINKLCSIYRDEIEDIDEKSVFWIILSDILLENKNLTKFVKEKALEIINSGYDLERWKEEANKEDYMERKKRIRDTKEKIK